MTEPESKLTPEEKLLRSIFGEKGPDLKSKPFSPKEHEKLKGKIRAALEALQDSREREAIKLSYGLGDGYIYTLEQIGKTFKVTRERARQIVAKGERHLRSHLESE